LEKPESTGKRRTRSHLDFASGIATIAGTSTASNQEDQVTGPELKQLRKDLSDALGKQLSAADMAKLCGLAPGGGADTIRRWEVSGPSGPADKLLGILAMASDRYPILENFNVFDRFNIPEAERPARRQEFREKMRDEIRERLE
jgi:DNA-binding transcriptional regulator YiaG